MLRMIIADDEPRVLNGIRKVLDLEKLDVEIIAEAGNGRDTLDLCERMNPDILFTDIRMPIMDGLEVALELKERERNIKVIFLSGVHDFNYAKTALDVEAAGYVLKPVKAETLNIAVGKVANRIRLDRRLITEMEELKVQMQDHMPVLRTNFLRNLVNGRISKEIQIEEKSNFLNLTEILKGPFMAALVKRDSDIRNEQNSEEAKQLSSLQILNTLRNLLNNEGLGIAEISGEQDFFLIFNGKAHQGDRYVDLCEEIIKVLDEVLNIPVSIGLGKSVNTVLNLSESFKEANGVFRLQYYTGNKSILHTKDIDSIIADSDQPDGPAFSNKDDNRLFEYIKTGAVKETGDIINAMFQHMLNGEDSYPPVASVQRRCIEIACGIADILHDENFPENNSLSNTSLPEMIDNIYAFVKAEDLRIFITGIVLRTSEYFFTRYSQKNSQVICHIKDFIDKKFHTNISVSQIADDVYLTPNYVSLIFKKETGKTITEFITEVRMEEAKKLLSTTELKIFEIAQMVGYEDPHYFSRAFKKYTGIQAKQFRK